VRIGEANSRQMLVEALLSERTKRLELRRGHESVWWNNIALLSGDHYTTWNGNQGQFVDVPRDDDDMLQLVVNHSLTVARVELSRLVKSHPIMEVLAHSEDSEDISATKVAKAALEGAEWKFKLRKVRKDAMWWMIATGLGAIYVGYDPNDDKDGKRQFVIDPHTNEAVFDPDRIEEIQGMLEDGEIDSVDVEEHPLGDLCYKVLSPFQLLPDPTRLEFEEIRDLITTEAVNIDEAKSLWGSAAAKLSPEHVVLGAMERRAISRAGLVGSTVDPEIDDVLQVHTYWLVPNYYSHNKFLRAGVMMRFTTNGEILEFAPSYPYDDGRIPYTFFQHIPSVMSIWPQSIMQHVRPINLELDKAMSQIVEAKDYMANPMWVVATQHQIKGRIRNRAGNIVRYTHVPNVPEPSPVPGIGVPSQVENTVVALRDQILDISGQSETSFGRVPSGVRSGVAVAYLTEQDETKLGPTAENVEEATALQSSLTLSRFGQFYTTTRIIQLYKPGGFFDVLRFKGSDLKGITDVVPVAGSALPKSQAARKEFVMGLVEMGIEKDPKRIKEMLELGQGEPDDVDKAFMQADRENQLMLKGVQTGKLKLDPGDEEAVSKAIPVKKWHNHAAHLSRHYSQMMDEEFDRLAETHPDIVRLYDEHTAMHEQALAAKQQQAMQAAEAAKGAPGGMVPPGGGDQMQQQAAPEGQPSADMAAANGQQGPQ
jgi:hypothetical protein